MPKVLPRPECGGPVTAPGPLPWHRPGGADDPIGDTRRGRAPAQLLARASAGAPDFCGGGRLLSW